MRRPPSEPRRPGGFTLVEMIVVMTLLAVLAVVAIPLLQVPVRASVDATRRAELAQKLGALQMRLLADFATAMPGSVRVQQVGSRWLVEYLELRAVGRHRAGLSGAPQACPAVCAVANNQDSLEAGCSETCFTALGPLVGATPVPGSDWIVVNPIAPGVPAGDPYLGGMAVVPGGIKTRLTAWTPGVEPRLDVAAQAFPGLAASRRFYVVAQPVSWECDAGSGRIVRWAGYPIAAAQPAAFGAATAALQLDGVQGCRIVVRYGGDEGRATVDWWVAAALVDASTGIPERSEWVGSYAVGQP